ncbi:venom allergen 3 homolog [Drosophila eugracilis]|uniref:venom allergen 3 homolog n=1 Tax=Drosophila eugracilis TaxID=29029 RepID=UPI001BDA106A|nr:venom allergen 3 homolog [Drosophila eugracilis]
MQLWLVFLLLNGIESHVVYRTRWPKYIQKKRYNKPVKTPDYCHGSICPNYTVHITCGVRFWSPRCGKNHQGIKLTPYRDDILRKVNTIRRSVERGLNDLPRAAKLPALSWDEELSVMAMRVTNQCSEHSQSLCVNTFHHRDVGESTDFMELRSNSKGFNALNFIDLWFDLYTLMRPEYVQSFPDVSPEDHLKVFANLIYEKNRQIGCGLLKSKKRRFFTCLFNKKIIPNQPLYKTRTFRTPPKSY